MVEALALSIIIMLHLKIVDTHIHTELINSHYFPTSYLHLLRRVLVASILYMLQKVVFGRSAMVFVLGMCESTKTSGSFGKDLLYILIFDICITLLIHSQSLNSVGRTLENIKSSLTSNSLFNVEIL